jgi:hypothetical protein
MFRNKLILSLTMLAVLVFSSAGLSQPPGPPGAGGRVIAGGGKMSIPENSVVLATDDCPGFRTPWGPWKYAHARSRGPSSSPIPMRICWGVPNWDEAIKHLSTHRNGSVPALVLSGHGSSEGGVATLNGATHLSYPNLQDRHAAVIQAKLRHDAPVIILGCRSGTSDNLTRMAKKLGRRVVANTGTVYTDQRGEGSWVEFRP